MNVFEEKKEIVIKRIKANTEIVVARPPKSLFKVVVNNYRKVEEQQSFDSADDLMEPGMDDQHGLPPQPTGYLKYPTYDWL